MKPEKEKEIFEKYNPVSDVVRCPYGKGPQRKLLDTYARAAQNLYGLITRKEFVEIFNGQNLEQTTEEEVYTLLLPLIRKQTPYAFYKEYIVSKIICDRPAAVAHFLNIQGDKPRYIPDREEFIRYADETYHDNQDLVALNEFFHEEFGYSQATSRAWRELLESVVYGDSFHQLGPIMDRYGLIFSGKEKAKSFLDLVTRASNSIRLWDNKGHTPDELHDISLSSLEAVPAPVLKQRTKVGRNEPCPCGSGKKYKKCCGKYDDSKTAQLSDQECAEFYRIWYGLLGYVNDRQHVIPEKIRPDDPHSVSDMQMLRVREALWENPRLFDAYIREGKLSRDSIEILELWRDKYKQGMMMLVEYKPDYAVVLSSDDKGEDILYGVRGVSTSIANALRLPLPVPVNIVLLPFKGKIVYDTYIESVELGFAQGAQRMIREICDRVRPRGITTSLE